MYLSCERENEWLDEAPYYIDISLGRRRGGRRRKSMDPCAIAKLNGMLAPTPVRNHSRGCNSAPGTPANKRRESALWIRTPEEESPFDGVDHDDADSIDEDGAAEWIAALTPVPKTPAPEAIARYAANISPGSTSPSSVGSLDSEDLLTRHDGAYGGHPEMLLRTCPPKRTALVEPGEGVLGNEKDEKVLMRLMAARRKSLQFAPKVGSPLAKTWRAGN